MKTTAVLWALLSLSGCVRQIHQVYARELRNVCVGMSEAEFAAVMPDAYPAAQATHNGHAINAQEVTASCWQTNRPCSAPEQKLWFYFVDGRLNKWGRPGDWPAPPDVIVEERRR